MNYHQMLIRDLQDLYQAEMEQARQLPQLASEAASGQLRSAFKDHARETQQQLLRLRQIFEMLGVDLGGEGQVLPGVRGLISEAQTKAYQVKDPLLRDLALIAGAQEMEHYEVACYGTARAMAHTAELDEAARLLQTTLAEEEVADRRLTEVALPIHKQAAESDPTVPY